MSIWNLKVFAAAAGLVVLGLLVYILWPRDNWERDNAPRLAAIKAEAEAAVMTRDYERSYAKCKEIVSLVGTRTLEDTALRAILNYAKTNKAASANKLASNAVAAAERAKAEEKVRVATWPINLGWTNVLPEGFVGNSPMLLHQALTDQARTDQAAMRAVVSSKGVYETTAEYEARKKTAEEEARKKAAEQPASAIAIGHLSAKALWAFLVEGDTLWSYDADRGELTLRIEDPLPICYAGEPRVEIHCGKVDDLVLKMTPREARSMANHVQLLCVCVPVPGSASYESPAMTFRVAKGTFEERGPIWKLSIRIQEIWVIGGDTREILYKQKVAPSP